MTRTQLADQAVSGSDTLIGELLEQNNQYIQDLARRHIPRHIAPSEILDLEVDELSQKVRIKFWLALRKGHILNHRAYLRCILHTEIVDLLRKYRPTLSLSPGEEDEHGAGPLEVAAGDECDPAIEVEREETLADYLEQATTAVRSLPPRQQRAIICEMKEKLADILPLAHAFKCCKIDIEKVEWPREKKDLLRLKASLTVSRKKLRLRLLRPEPQK